MRDSVKLDGKDLEEEVLINCVTQKNKTLLVLQEVLRTHLLLRSCNGRLAKRAITSSMLLPPAHPSTQPELVVNDSLTLPRDFQQRSSTVQFLHTVI